MGQTNMTTENVEALRQRGPLSREELPRGKVTTEDKMNGVWIFKPSQSKSPSTDTGFIGKPKYVAYLKDEHDPKEVVQKHVELNEDKLDKLHEEKVHDKARDRIYKMYYRQGEEFAQAFADMRGAYPHL